MHENIVMNASLLDFIGNFEEKTFFLNLDAIRVNNYQNLLKHVL